MDTSVPRTYRACAAAVLLLVAAGSTAAMRGSTSRSLRSGSGGSTQRSLARARKNPVQVTADHFLGHVEPDVAVNPRDPANLLGACQFETKVRQRLPGTFVSFDGGLSWRDNELLPLPRGYEVGADTTVGFSREGTGYVAALMWHGGNGSASQVRRGGIFLWKTRNRGRNFSTPLPVYVGRGFQDHPWLAVRNSPRGAVLYLAWTNRAGLEFTHSKPGTTLFAPPRLLAGGSAPSTPVLVTGPRSELEIFFQAIHFPSGSGKFQPLPAKLNELTSLNDGRTFARAHTIAKVTIVAGLGGQQPPPLLAAAADPSTPRSAVAIAAQDRRTGHPVIELWQRASATARWRGPLRPATGPAASLAQEQPRLVYDSGRLYMSYFTISRNGATRERLAHAPEDGTLFTQQQLPGSSFAATGFIGDYQALAIAGAHGYAVWNSKQSGRLQIVAGRFPITPRSRLTSAPDARNSTRP